MVLADAVRSWPQLPWSPVSADNGPAALASSNEPPVNAPRAYDSSSDADLVSWSADGDRRAFDQIVVRHGPFALRVAFRIVRDRQVAEDVAQEALVRAWAEAARFDPRRARFTTWLYRIIVNLCIDHVRRQKPESLPVDLDSSDPSANADEMIEANERHARLAGAVEGLPPRQRAALTLVYDEGLSGAEAARVLGLTAKAVERLLARARAYLRARLQREQPREQTRKGSRQC